MTQEAQTSEDTARGWRPYHTLWGLPLLCWTMSAADRTLTGPVVTWMIEADAGIDHVRGRVRRVAELPPP